MEIERLTVLREKYGGHFNRLRWKAWTSAPQFVKHKDGKVTVCYVACKAQQGCNVWWRVLGLPRELPVQQCGAPNAPDESEQNTKWHKLNQKKAVVASGERLSIVRAKLVETSGIVAYP